MSVTQVTNVVACTIVLFLLLFVIFNMNSRPIYTKHCCICKESKNICEISMGTYFEYICKDCLRKAIQEYMDVRRD
jgi:hypothetical protein